MSDWMKIVEGIASGLLTGGASSLATVLATFRDIRNRISIVEERLGAPAVNNTSPGSGLFYRLDLLDSALAKLQKEIGSWEDDPPGWITRLITRAGRGASVNMEVQQEFEERILSRLRSFQERMDRWDDRARDSWTDDKFVSRQEYEADMKRRAEEFVQMRENLATANGLLRGVMTAMGVIDKPEEPPPNRSTTRRGGQNDR
jgi:hypothetical protein